MSNKTRKLFAGTSLALSATVALSSAAIAEDSQAVIDQISQYNDANSFAQVNSVFQLRDVAPSDWAFDALRNLVEKYNCIVGYPDGTFRGNRPLSRYEFAAGLNACMQQIERLIIGGGSDVDAADITRLRALVQEFEAELATLGARVDDIEGRVEFLEDNQFSTTTKLNGEVIFNLAAALSPEDKVNGSGDDTDDEVVFSNRVRLNLDTSFTGKDRLRTRLQAANMPRFDRATGVDAARLGYDSGGDNNVTVSKLWYRTPLGNKATFHVGTVGLGLDDIFDVTNPKFASSGGGALTRFGRFNPIYRGPSGAGVGLNLDFTDRVSFSAAYLTGDANDPTDKNGLFNGSYSLGAQLDFKPADRFMLSATYVNRYQKTGDVNLSGSTGSALANDFTSDNAAASSNSFGVQASWKAAEKLNIAGWVGYTDASVEDPNASGDADVLNWAVNAAISDVGGDGNVLGLIFGQTPNLIDGEFNQVDVDSNTDTSYLAELQYRYKLSDNITITPGAYVIFNPNENDNNDAVWVGTLRTTFKF